MVIEAGTPVVPGTPVVLGLGGNIGAHRVLRSRFIDAGQRISSLRYGDTVRWAQLYETVPVGPVQEQPNFLNTACEFMLQAPVLARTLMQDLLAIEKALGRSRIDAVAQGPRAIDIDILLCGDIRLDDPDITIPHPRICDRSFVLAPLRDLLGSDYRLPGASTSLAELLLATGSAGCARSDWADLSQRRPG